MFILSKNSLADDPLNGLILLMAQSLLLPPAEQMTGFTLLRKAGAWPIKIFWSLWSPFSEEYESHDLWVMGEKNFSESRIPIH